MTPFSINNEDVSKLGPDRAVKFFRRLLWAEAGKIEIGKDLINVPECINESDGGIDAKLENIKHSFTDSLIKEGTTGYQIKAGDLTPKECKEELHQKNDIDKPLKPGIKKLLDNGGRYVLVLFDDLTDLKYRNRKNALSEELNRLGYSNDYELLTAAKIANVSEQFPSLAIWLSQNRINCLSYHTWSSDTDVSKPEVFIQDDQRKGIISEIREIIRDNSYQNNVIRITGLPGIGKTRLVYETVSEEDLSPRVLYCRADSFISSSQYNLIQNNPDYDIILVVDECDTSQHDILYKALSNKQSVRAIITMSYDMRQVPAPTKFFKLDTLSKDKIKELITTQTQALGSLKVERISQFADGYPRIATLLVESYLQNPSRNEEKFIQFNDEVLIDRLIGGNNISGQRFENHKKTLRALSIFTKIGFENEVSAEIEWLSNHVNLDIKNIREVVYHQKKRGIIQGSYYIYVTPYMLRTFLFKEWWNIQSFDQKKFNSFVSSFPEQYRDDLFQRFIKQIPLIGDNKKGRQFVEELLNGEKGIFKNPEFLKEKFGSAFFLKITEAHPKAALDYLKKSLGKWDKEKFKEFKNNRINILWALQRIAIWEDLFKDAAKILLKFVETEYNNYMNEAKGIFQDLFSLGYGEMASTEASPSKRFELLEEMIESDSREIRKIAYETCKSALGTNFTKVIGPEYQGLRKEPNLWHPNTYSELYQAYANIWNLLSNKLDRADEKEKEHIAEILLERARGINKISNLSDLVINTLKKLKELNAIDSITLSENISRIIYYDKDEMSSATLSKWKKLKEQLVGKGFDAELNRYVGTRIIEDYYDEEGNYNEKIITDKIDALAQKAINNRELLNRNLNWLLSNKANRSFQFGYYLKKNIKSEYKNLLDQIIKNLEDPNDKDIKLLSGFLKGIHKEDEKEWNKIIQTLANKPKWPNHVPKLLNDSGINRKSLDLIIELVKKDKLEVNSLKQLQHLNFIKDLGQEGTETWLSFLVYEIPNSISHSIALRVLDTNYITLENNNDLNLPQKITFNVITSDYLLTNYNPEIRDQMVSYSWERVASKFIEDYPEDNIKIAKKIVAKFGDENSIFSTYKPSSGSILNKILKKSPEEVWEIISKELSPPLDIKSYQLSKWLRGGSFEADHPSPLNHLSPEIIFDWVDKDIENRAWYLATFVPPELFIEKSNICLARRVLIKYGGREDVRRNLHSNFSTGSWTGPESSYLSKQVNHLKKHLEKETEKNVIKWINERIDLLNKRIQAAEIREDRGY